MSVDQVFKKGWVPKVQGQVRPGLHCKLDPPPVVDITADGQPYKPAGKLKGKTALVTGGDSGVSTYHSAFSSAFRIFCVRNWTQCCSAVRSVCVYFFFSGNLQRRQPLKEPTSRWLISNK